MSLYHHLMALQKYSREGEGGKSHPYLIGKVITFASEPELAALLAKFQVRSISLGWKARKVSLYYASETKYRLKARERAPNCSK